MKIEEEGESLRIEAPAKLNLYLELLSKRPDGYHEIDTILHEVDLCDTLRLTPIREGVEFVTDDPTLPAGEENLCVRAARAWFRGFDFDGGVRIELTKRIPAGAGLGGGSSDAAAVLAGLDRLHERGSRREELADIAAEIGSDVPFFLYGGSARCTGRGEIIRPVEFRGIFHFVLVCPLRPLSTADVYRGSTIPLTPQYSKATMLQEALRCGDSSSLGSSSFNRLEEAARRLSPDVDRCREQLSRFPFEGIALTGSGSGMFGVAGSERDATEFADGLRKEGTDRVYVLHSGRETGT